MSFCPNHLRANQFTNSQTHPHCTFPLYKHPEVVKLKIGRANAVALLGNVITQSTRDKISMAHKGKPHPWVKGHVPTQEEREALRKRMTGRVVSLETRLKISGSRNHLWKGGISTENMLIRQSIEMHRWRREVYRRDNFTCQKCGVSKNLVAHHIKEFSNYPELRFVVDNGQTLCKDCHKLTDNYGTRCLKKLRLVVQPQ